MSRSTKTVLIIGIILLIAAAAGGTWYYFTQMSPPSSKPDVVTETPVSVTQQRTTPIGKPVVGPISLPNYCFRTYSSQTQDEPSIDTISTHYGNVTIERRVDPLLLKNKDISLKIEESVDTLITDIAQNPEKYGILLDDTKHEYSMSIYRGCFNNIAYYDIDFGNVIFGMNYDLNTGNEIALCDVFVDNCDYMSLIGKYYALEGLNDGAPYSKLNPNKMFSLSVYGLSLGEASTVSSGWSNPIPYDTFGNNIAIFDRFMLSDESLFEDDVRTEYHLFEAPLEFDYDSLYEWNEDCYASATDQKLSASSELPAAVISTVNSIFTNRYDDFTEQYNLAMEGHNEFGRYMDYMSDGTSSTPHIGSYNRFSYIWRGSNYIFASCGENYEIIDWQGQPFSTYTYSKNIIVDATTGAEIPYTKLFKNGFDIAAAIQEKLAEDSIYLEKDAFTITKADIYSYGIYFDIEYLEDDEIRERGAHLSFSAIGYENLILFDKLR